MTESTKKMNKITKKPKLSRKSFGFSFAYCLPKQDIVIIKIAALSEDLIDFGRAVFFKARRGTGKQVRAKPKPISLDLHADGRKQCREHVKIRPLPVVKPIFRNIAYIWGGIQNQIEGRSPIIRI